MDVPAAEFLVAAVKDRDISLAGIKPDQATADLSHNGLGPGDAMLLASDLSKAGVSASLTKVDVRANRLGEEGKAALRKAVEARPGFELGL